MKDTFQETHENIMHMRHNFAAHSGADNFEEVKIALVLPPNKNSAESPRIYTELMQPDFSEDSENKFIDLAKHVHSAVQAKTDKVRDKIYEKEIFSKGKMYWYKKSK